MAVLDEFHRAHQMLTQGHSFADVCIKPEDEPRRKQTAIRSSSSSSSSQRRDQRLEDAAQRFDARLQATRFILGNHDFDGLESEIPEYEYDRDEREALSALMTQMMSGMRIEDLVTYNRYPTTLPSSGHQASLTLAGFDPFDRLDLQSAVDPYGAVADVERVYSKHGEIELRVLVDLDEDLDEDELPEELEFETVILERVGRVKRKKGKLVARYEASDFLF